MIVSIAKAHGVHPALICIKWAVQRGQIPIPMSTNPRNYIGNLRAAVEDPLTAAEMAAIAKIDHNCRLIKGQVFLWEGAKGLGRLVGPRRRHRTLILQKIPII